MISLVRCGEIDVRLLDSGRVRVLRPVPYDFSNGLRIISPSLYECDLASVPFPFRGVLPNQVKSSAGAVLHDRCYSHAEAVELEIRARHPQFATFEMTRWVADALARVVWDAKPATENLDWIYWAGVRVGGRRTWNAHREARAEEARRALA